MKSEPLIILCGVGLIALLWLLLRFGRTIAKAALVGGILVIVVIVALALLRQAGASQQAAQAATVATTGQAVSSVGTMVAIALGSLCIGALGTMALAGAGTAAFFWYRSRLPVRDEPRRIVRREPQALSLTGQSMALPQQPEVMYVVDQAPTVAAQDVNMEGWGW